MKFRKHQELDFLQQNLDCIKDHQRSDNRLLINELESGEFFLFQALI